MVMINLKSKVQFNLILSRIFSIGKVFNSLKGRIKYFLVLIRQTGQQYTKTNM